MRAALLAALIALAAVAAEARTLTIGITQYPATLHPSLESMLATRYVLGMAIRPFVVFDKDWTPVCLLCERLPSFETGDAERVPVPKDIGDGSGEGVAVTYTIRADLFWGDGAPVTVDDVILAWEVGKHPKTGAPNAESFRRILEIRKLDARTFTVVNDRVEFRYNLLLLTPLPDHIERPIFEADPAAYRNRTAYLTQSDNPGLYSGPYRISGVQPGASITLAPNSAWRGPTPAFERVVVRTIGNTAALEANLRSGAIDYIAGEIGLTIDQAIALERRARGRYRFQYRPGLIYEHIDVNLDHPALGDRRVRQALLLGANREGLSAALFDGRQPVAHGSVAPEDPAASDDLPRYPYDPARAAALLDAAGWTRDGEGVRRNAEGAPLAFEFMTTAGDRLRELAQQSLQSDWAKLGVQVSIRNQPPRVYFGETVSKRKFTGLAMFAWLSSPETPPRTTLHSTYIPTEANAWSGQNYTGYSNPAIDKLLDAIEVELDVAKRGVLWAELQRIYSTDLPALPLYFRAQPFVLPPWLEGVEPTGHQFPTTLWIETWRDGRK